jgi:Sec-independent protein translocase protein TatA
MVEQEDDKAPLTVPRPGRKRDYSWLKNWRVRTLCGGCLFAGFLVGMLIFGSPWHLPPAWGDIPTWITAIATVGLLAGAIVTAIYAIRAFREQAKEVRDQAEILSIQSDQLAEQRKINEKQTKVLELQADELRESLVERKRETESRRRDQASRVFIWEERGEDEVNFPAGSPPAPWVTTYVVNTSEQPVYSVLISWRLGDRGESQRHLMPLMPGAEAKDTRAVPPGADPAAFNAVAFFRDAAGVTWRTWLDGQLDEIPAGHEPPHTW